MPSDNASQAIPQSDALAEAQVESLSELFSRDPEGYNDADLDRIIGALREQRARWAQVDAAPVRAAKAKKTISLSEPMTKTQADELW